MTKKTGKGRRDLMFIKITLSHLRYFYYGEGECHSPLSIGTQAATKTESDCLKILGERWTLNSLKKQSAVNWPKGIGISSMTLPFQHI